MSKYDKDLDRILNKLDTMDERLDKIEKKVYVLKIFFSVLKWVGSILVLLLTLKFGDISSMIKGIF